MIIPPKYDYNKFYIPKIQLGEDNNKPQIYKLLDNYTYYYNKKPKPNENTEQFKQQIQSIIKKISEEIYNYILNNPMSLIEIYSEFRPFIYAMYCGKYTLMGLYNIFKSIPSDIQKLYLIQPWDYTVNFSFNIFHLAILSNLKEQMRYLYRINPLINATDINGNTPLHLACILKRTSIIDTMIYYKNGDVNLLNNFGESPLYICMKTNYTNGFKKLIEHGANLSYMYGIRKIDLEGIIKYDNDLPLQHRKINDEIKEIFFQKKLARKRKVKISTKLLKESEMNKRFLKEHSKLCSKIDEVIDMNLLYNLAKHIEISKPEKYNRENLCKKIATKMLIKSYSKKYIH